MKFSSIVIKGEGMGKKLGFPTINLVVPKNFDLADGVYACEVKTNVGIFKGGLHYGFKKTLSPNIRSLEIHLKNFNGDLYGKEVEVEILRFIRENKSFSNIEELKMQIAKDIDAI